MNTKTFASRLADMKRRYKAVPRAARHGQWQIGERSLEIAGRFAQVNPEYAEVRLSEAEYFIPYAEALAETMEEVIHGR
jgi:hypothetical protein